MVLTREDTLKCLISNPKNISDIYRDLEKNVDPSTVNKNVRKLEEDYFILTKKGKGREQICHLNLFGVLWLIPVVKFHEAIALIEDFFNSDIYNEYWKGNEYLPEDLLESLLEFWLGLLEVSNPQDRLQRRLVEMLVLEPIEMAKRDEKSWGSVDSVMDIAFKVQRNLFEVIRGIESLGSLAGLGVLRGEEKRKEAYKVIMYSRDEDTLKGVEGIKEGILSTLLYLLKRSDLFRRHFKTHFTGHLRLFQEEIMWETLGGCCKFLDRLEKDEELESFYKNLSKSEPVKKLLENEC